MNTLYKVRSLRVGLIFLFVLFTVMGCFTGGRPRPAFASFPVLSGKVATGRYYSLVVLPDGTVWAWGRNNYGQLGDGTNVDRITPVQVKGPNGDGYLTGVVAVAAGENHSLALRYDGTVWAWGLNDRGQLGDKTTTNKNTPVQVKGRYGDGYLTDIVAIAAGRNHSLALNSSGRALSWGDNTYSQLGCGNATPYYTSPTNVVNSTGYAFSGISAIAAGEYHSLLIKNDGTVWCWGLNSQGQIGDGTTIFSRPYPRQVKGPNGVDYLMNAVAIAAGNSHSVALKSDGTVWAWGNNANGQLGDGTNVNRTTPVQVKGSNGEGYLMDIVALAAGGFYSLAIKSDNTLWAWGANEGGQLGDATNIGRTTPVQVKGQEGNGYLMDVVSVEGEYHTLAVTADNKVWAWGNNTYGQVGDGTTTYRYTPVLVLPNLVTINVIPSSLTLSMGDTKQLTVVANYSDGSTQDVTNSATYTSSNPSVVTVSSGGLISAVNIGSATITVDYGSKTAEVPVTVTAVVESLKVTPSSVSLPTGRTQQLSVTANYSDGSTQDVTNSASYNSSDPGVATVSSSGLVTAVGTGSATITVSCESKTVQVPVEVTAPSGGLLIGEINIIGGKIHEVNGRQVCYVNSDIISMEISFTLSGTYRVRYDPGNASWLGWYNWSGSRVVETVVLAKGMGANLVRVEVEKDGNTDYSELIVAVDQVPPTISRLRGFRGATATTNPDGTAILEINVTDNLPGQLYYQYQINGGTPSSWLPLTGSTISVSGLSPGANSITVNVKDQAGNVSSATVTIFRI